MAGVWLPEGLRLRFRVNRFAPRGGEHRTANFGSLGRSPHRGSNEWKMRGPRVRFGRLGDATLPFVSLVVKMGSRVTRPSESAAFNSAITRGTFPGPQTPDPRSRTRLRLASVFVPHCGTTPGQAGGQARTLNIEFEDAFGGVAERDRRGACATLGTGRLGLSCLLCVSWLKFGFRRARPSESDG